MLFRNKKTQSSLKPFKDKNFVMPTLADLRTHSAYKIAHSSEDIPIIIGRGEPWKLYMAEEIAKGEVEWKKYEELIKIETDAKWEYQCKVAYIPEASRSKYDRNGNLAFILGGMEARRKFMLLNSLEEICETAREGLRELEEQIKKEGKPSDKWSGLGGCFAELTWILSGKYDIVNEDGIFLALPLDKAPVKFAEQSIPRIMQKCFDMTVDDISDKIQLLEDKVVNLKKTSPKINCL